MYIYIYREKQCKAVKQSILNQNLEKCEDKSNT